MQKSTGQRIILQGPTHQSETNCFTDDVINVSRPFTSHWQSFADADLCPGLYWLTREELIAYCAFPRVEPMFSTRRLCCGTADQKTHLFAVQGAIRNVLVLEVLEETPMLVSRLQQQVAFASHQFFLYG